MISLLCTNLFVGIEITSQKLCVSKIIKRYHIRQVSRFQNHYKMSPKIFYDGNGNMKIGFMVISLSTSLKCPLHSMFRKKK